MINKRYLHLHPSTGRDPIAVVVPAHDRAMAHCDCGDHLLDLLPCAPMLISSLVMLGILWHAVRTLPGFLESVGYVFGILLASFMLDACFPRHVD
jgi:hypothetical protein